MIKGDIWVELFPCLTPLAIWIDKKLENFNMAQQCHFVWLHFSQIITVASKLVKYQYRSRMIQPPTFTSTKLHITVHLLSPQPRLNTNFKRGTCCRIKGWSSAKLNTLTHKTSCNEQSCDHMVEKWAFVLSLAFSPSMSQIFNQDLS